MTGTVEDAKRPKETGVLPLETARLVQSLRDLRTRTGLSLAALAAKTAYSKSSWERYLNGRTLPPRQAVLALCALAGEPPDRCLALWELASCADGKPAVAPNAPAAQKQPPLVHPRRHLLGRAGIALGCVAASGTLAIALWPGTSPQAVPRCHDRFCDGKSPASTLCDLGLTTLATVPTSDGAQLDIRYSARCQTVWARVTQSRPGDRIDITVSGGRSRSAQVVDVFDAQGYVYTPMATVEARHDVRACLTPATGGARQCVTKYVPR